MNHAESAAPQFVRALPRLIIGLAVMAAGLLWTLDNLNFVESDRIAKWWPAVVIVVGLVRFADPYANKTVSLIVMIAGAGLLFNTLQVWEFDFGDLFPLLIAFIGGKLVLDAIRRRQMVVTPSDDPDATVHAFAFMSGVGRRSVSADFRGGDANAIMGGTELDLREARIRDGQQAVLDTFAFWGGVEIRVPENWRVVSEVLPLMGAFEDNTAGKTTTAESGPVLIVRGVAIMGAVEVKN